MYQEPDYDEDIEDISSDVELVYFDFRFHLRENNKAYIESKNNLRRKAFFTPMKSLKPFLKKTFGLNFDSFNCWKVFGSSLISFKEKMKWKIYKLLCYYPENEQKLMKYLETETDKKKS